MPRESRRNREGAVGFLSRRIPSKSVYCPALRVMPPSSHSVKSEIVGRLLPYRAHSHAAQILQEWEMIEAIEPMQRCLQRYEASTDAVISNLKKYASPELTTAIEYLIKLREKP
jgi:hypothetical protein